jgi:hypothetical protein
MAAPANNKNLTYLILGLIIAGIVGYGIYYFTEGPGDKSPDIEISVGEGGMKIDTN